MNAIFKYFSVVGLFFISTNFAYALTTITSLPFNCNQANETYILSSDLSIGSGNGITVNANNIIIDGNGHTITYASSSGAGVAILINTNVSSLEIKNTIFTQGNYDPANNERPHSIYRSGSASGVKIHNNTFNIQYTGSTSGNSVYVINLINAGNNSYNNEIHSNNINISGESGARGINIDTRHVWEGSIHHNNVFMRDLYHGPAGYARAIMVSGNGNGNGFIHNNTITLDGSIDTAQGLSTWNADNFEFYDNTINSAANHARSILIDGDSDGNKIYRNTVNMTTQWSNASASAGIRVRYGSDNNIIYQNIIDASTGNSSYPLRLGGDDGLGQPTGTVIHNNTLSSKTRVISIEEGSDIVFYNNTITPVDAGYALYFWCTSSQNCDNVSFNADQVNGDVLFTGINGQTGATNVAFCQSITADDINVSSGNHQYVISQNGCPYPGVAIPMPPSNVAINQI